MGKLRKVILLVLVLLVPGIAYAATTLTLIDATVEVGDVFPSPYSCLSYSGHNDAVAALYAQGCGGVKRDGWIYAHVNSAGDFIFVWEGETLLLRPITPQNAVSLTGSQMSLYRRLPN
jgi:hypothetical protein